MLRLMTMRAAPVVVLLAAALLSGCEASGPATSPEAAPSAPPRVDAPAQADGGELAWTGATVCRRYGPDSTCRRAGPEAAERLDRALATATPRPDDVVDCAATSAVYTVQFLHPTLRPEAVIVPVQCGPVVKDGQEFQLSSDAIAQVKQVYDSA